MADERFAAAAQALAGAMTRAFGWRPDDFWSATPAEIAAIVGADDAPSIAVPVARGDLDRMMERFPDG